MGGEHLYDGVVAAPELAELRNAVKHLEVPADPLALEEAIFLADRLRAKISVALGEFDDAQGWSHDGSLSLTAWLTYHGRTSRREAHRQAVAAQRLRGLPVTAAAWADGGLSTGQVAAVMANVPERYLGLYAEQEPELAGALEDLQVHETAAAMRSWTLHAEALDDEEPPPERPSELHLSRTLDGRRELSGHLRPEDAAAVESALAAAESGIAELRAASERRAEALVGICRYYLDNQAHRVSAGRNRPYVNIVVDLDDLVTGGPGCTGDGTWLRPEDVSWLTCDSELHRVVTAGRSTVLDYGSATRTISQALWSALVVRDGHCRHPGCDRPPAWCEGHHIVHFSQGGPTCLSNIVLLCARHHHLYHAKGWELKLAEDATLTLITPQGEVLRSRPPPRWVGT